MRRMRVTCKNRYCAVYLPKEDRDRRRQFCIACRMMSARGFSVGAVLAVAVVQLAIAIVKAVTS